MSKKLFTPSPSDKWQSNVTAGGDFWIFGYSRGYYEAAQTLAVFATEGGFIGKFRGFRTNPPDYRIQNAQETALPSWYSTADSTPKKPIEGIDKNSVFFPICFNYRHYLELTLKRLIIDAEYLDFILQGLKQAHAKKLEGVKRRIGNEHRLKELLRRLIEQLELVKYDQGFDTTIHETIMEFHGLDPDGQTFRYPFRRDHNTKKQVLTLPVESEYDLESVRESMEAVYNHLSSIEVWLDHSISDAIESLPEEKQKMLDALNDLY